GRTWLSTRGSRDCRDCSTRGCNSDIRDLSSEMAFGISTHLYVADRLDRDHLVEIAAHGFEAIEVFGVRDHFDYRDRRAAIALAELLDDTRLRLHSMHAPIAGSYVRGKWEHGLSLAVGD